MGVACLGSSQGWGPQCPLSGVSSQRGDATGVSGLLSAVRRSLASPSGMFFVRCRKVVCDSCLSRSALSRRLRLAESPLIALWFGGSIPRSCWQGCGGGAPRHVSWLTMVGLVVPFAKEVQQGE